MTTHHNNTQGFAVLLSVLILAAVGVAIATSLLYLSVGTSQTALATQESAESNALANACAEEALQKLVTSSAFTGTGALTLGQGTCSYTVAVSGTNDSIKSIGTVGITVRKAEIIIAIPQLTISSWQEVSDFY
jgi:hypothetical protein